MCADKKNLYGNMIEENWFYFKILNKQTKLGNETGIELTSYVMLILSTIARSFKALLLSL